MANGGWYGTKEEWQRIEAPLLKVDSIIEGFSKEFDLTLTRNHKENPDRSMKWNGNNVSCLIQLYLVNEKDLTWNLWLCASQDRERGILFSKHCERFWKREMLIDGKPMADFQSNLYTILNEGRNKLNLWCDNPEGLEFATKIDPL